MEKSHETHRAYLRILKEELITSLGCTEPIALAFAAAKCRELLGSNPQRVEILASGSILKNVKSVIIPNTAGLKGMEAAAAAGIIAGNAGKELKVIETVDEAKQAEMRTYLETTEFKVGFLEGGPDFDLMVIGWSGEDCAKVRIADRHTNIVLLEKNGEKLLEIPVATGSDEGAADRELLNLEDIWNFATTCDVADVAELLEHQIRCNMSIAEEGLRGNYGANIGMVMLDAYGNGIANRAAAKAAAASDARMNGCEMPVVINSGSGNQGITCSVPVIEYAAELGSDHETLLRALTLSNLTTIYQKTGIGRLSAFCGAVSAGVAAGAGIAYLKGGGLKEVAHTLVNGLAVVSGMVCDGAKASCAAKIASSVNAGVLGYDMFIRGQQFYGGDGLVTKGVDNTIRNIAQLGRDGMRETNEEIIKIMLG